MGETSMRGQRTKDNDRVEMVLQARGCDEKRHVPQMRACAWVPDNHPCTCNANVLIDDILGGRIDEGSTHG